MKSLMWAFPIALVIFFYINESHSLQCYSCTTSTNSSNNCEVIDSQTYNETCAQNITHCMSILSIDTITRKCAANNTSCDQETGSTQCLECTADLCNNQTFSMNGTNNTMPTTVPTNNNNSTNYTITTIIPTNNTNSTNYNMTTIAPIYNITNTTTPTNNTKGSAAELSSQVLPLIICIISIVLNADVLTIR